MLMDHQFAVVVASLLLFAIAVVVVYYAIEVETHPPTSGQLYGRLLFCLLLYLPVIFAKYNKQTSKNRATTQFKLESRLNFKARKKAIDSLTGASISNPLALQTICIFFFSRPKFTQIAQHSPHYPVAHSLRGRVENSRLWRSDCPNFRLGSTQH